MQVKADGMIHTYQELMEEREKLLQDLTKSELLLKEQISELKTEIRPSKIIQSLTVELMSNKNIRNLLLSETALVFLSEFLMKKFQFGGNRILFWLLGKKKKSTDKASSNKHS